MVQWYCESYCWMSSLNKSPCVTRIRILWIVEYVSQGVVLLIVFLRDKPHINLQFLEFGVLADKFLTFTSGRFDVLFSGLLIASSILVSHFRRTCWLFAVFFCVIMMAMTSSVHILAILGFLLVSTACELNSVHCLVSVTSSQCSVWINVKVKRISKFV
jgi:hypothetical protein